MGIDQVRKRGRKPKYTVELVAPLVQRCHDWHELALALGMGWVNTEKTQPQVRQVVWKLGLDASHFSRKVPGGDYPPVPPVRVDPSEQAIIGRARREREARYTREFLLPLIEAGKNIQEVSQALGVCGVAAARRAIDRIGLPMPSEVPVPPRPPCLPRAPKYTVELVAPLVATCKNFHELAKGLGLKTKSSARRVTQRLGLDTRHFTRKPYATPVSRYGPSLRFGKCHRPWQEILVLHQEKVNASGDKLARALIMSGRAYQCSSCGLEHEWNGKTLRLQVDHINGIGWDDRPENLRFLCPNCHSQTDTFCNKNTRNLKGLGGAVRKPRRELWTSYQPGTRGSFPGPPFTRTSPILGSSG